MIKGFLPLKEGERRENREEARGKKIGKGRREEVKGSGDLALRS